MHQVDLIWKKWVEIRRRSRHRAGSPSPTYATGCSWSVFPLSVPHRDVSALSGTWTDFLVSTRLLVTSEMSAGARSTRSGKRSWTRASSILSFEAIDHLVQPLLLVTAIQIRPLPRGLAPERRPEVQHLVRGTADVLPHLVDDENYVPVSETPPGQFEDPLSESFGVISVFREAFAHESAAGKV